MVPFRSLTADQPAIRVRRIKNAYLVLAAIMGFPVIYLVAGLSHKHTTKESIIIFVPFLIYLAAYYGLKYKKNWAIPLIRITSLLALIVNIIMIRQPATNLSALVFKLVDVNLALFYVYQLFLFSKKEVRQLFTDKGTTIY